jgi:hypothetical protein
LLEAVFFMDPVAVFVLVGAGVAAWYWLRPRGASARGGETHLRRICQGNEAQAERLIEGEMTRAPGISRAEAAARAVERYRRDNR